VITAPKDGHK